MGGAIGVAILAKEEVKKKGRTNFKGTSIHKIDYMVNGLNVMAVLMYAK